VVTNCDLILYGEKIRIVCLSKQIDRMIRTTRVVLDRDLAEIYGVAGASQMRFLSTLGSQLESIAAPGISM